MAEPVRHISDASLDERGNARAISELLVRVGTLEGERVALVGEVNTLRMLLGEYRAELDRALHSVRASTGRSVAAAERVRKAQAQLAEDVIQVRAALRERQLG